MAGKVIVTICIVHGLVQRNQPDVVIRDLKAFGLLRNFDDITFVNAFGSGIHEAASESYQVLVFDDSFMVNRSSPVWTELMKRVGPLIKGSRRRALFLQDDYTRHDVTVAFALANDIEVFSVFSDVDELYADLGVVAEPWLIGFADHELDSELQSVKVPWMARGRDIGQRITRTPLEFGVQGRLKATLAEQFHREMKARGFVSDVSTHDEDRFFGADWFKFLANSRSTIGRHSGASFLTTSFRDSIRAQTVERSFSNESFETQLCRYKTPSMLEINLLAPSPRIFEAASLEVVQVLESSDVSYGIDPWEHFVPIAPDLGDIDLVASFLRSSEAPEMAARCRMALHGDERWRRETWLQRFADHFDLRRMAREGTIRVPEPEHSAYLSLAGLESRVDRWHALKDLCTRGLIPKRCPVEAVFRWRPAFDRMEGSD